MTLWTDKTAAAATGGKAQGAWQASRVEIDSRAIEPGDLFIAIQGERFDGHDYVADALKKGAVAAAVSKPPLPNPPPLRGRGNSAESSLPEGGRVREGAFPLLIVPDTLKALEGLGTFARAQTKAKIIGVTGSVGKSSTKEMLRLALSAHGNTYASGGNRNNHIGTPYMLANLPKNAQFAVFEMGMNHAGEISHLTKMVRPDVAIITNVEAVHMEFFPSIEGIADAKAEIFEGLQKGGTAVLNADSPHFAHLQQAAMDYGVARFESFGEAAHAGCRLISYRPTATGCAIEADVFGKRLSYTMKAIGRHWATTSLLTLAVTHALGLNDEKTAKALAVFSEMEGRGRLASVNGITLIDDSYNASPAAMRAAFKKTAEVWEGAGKKGRKLAALGNMLELGSEGPKLHTLLAADLQAANFDGVFTAGELMQNLSSALPANLRAGHVNEAMQLLPLLKKELRAGDILLVKGSHGSKMYELVSILRDALASAQGPLLNVHNV